MFIALLQRNVSSERRTKWEKKKEFWSSVQSSGKQREQEMTQKVSKKRMRKPEPSSVQYNQKVN